MGKCVRIRGGSSKPPPPPPATSSFLTLRSGRRVRPVAASSSACGPRTSGRPRRHRGSALRWCGAAEAATADKQRACGSGSPRGRTAADAGSPSAGLVLGAQRLCDDGRPEEEEVPPSRAADAGAAVERGVDHCRGDSFERPKTPLMAADDCDAALAKAKAKHENESRRRGVVAGQTPPPPPPPMEAEIEAFFAAAEQAERRRFAETYNYDVSLDRPLEGRFEWAPVNT